ncbi:MAG: hypothetical protein A4E20_10800 [Nitrospira sp. SG-bin2]|uniref:phage portal protein n=1 Tax=Nitrospira cf. moscoviensis SBR1015 TaxID=96242 RepID=UPI000A0B0A57|nr:phage portal protein [Nitrospira cf. moscoviensis SBR1015]OQW34500.1 MAG: hypothetical protein A4E20_10800 [Nitrospira sp. SG-bin2]
MAGLTEPWEIPPPGAVIKLPKEDLSGKELAKFIRDDVMPVFQTERCRLQLLELWGTGQQPTANHYKGQNKEKLVLKRFSRNPWITLMVSTFAQQMIVDGFRKDGSRENEKAWDTWLANNMPAQQLTINRTTIIAGYSFVRVTQGIGADKSVQAVIRAVDPQNAFAIYTDPGDDYPRYLLEKLFDGTYRWWDSTRTVELDDELEYVQEANHAYGVVPFVRYLNQVDAKGRCWGDVEPVVELAARMDKTVLDRLLVQHFNSFKVRYGTGLEQPDTEEKTVAAAKQLQHGDFLASSNELAKFGTLDETVMDPFIAAYKSDLESFLAITQLPPDLVGQVANIAADALEASRRGTYQKLFEKQTMFGQSHAQVLRLAALIEGRPDDANDYTARVHWQDVQIRSLAQYADAWGKICAQLGYPKDLAWVGIPGVDQADVALAKEGYFNDTGEHGRLNKYLRELGIKPDGAVPGQRGGTNSMQNQPKPVTSANERS